MSTHMSMSDTDTCQTRNTCRIWDTALISMDTDT